MDDSRSRHFMYRICQHACRCLKSNGYPEAYVEAQGENEYTIEVDEVTRIWTSLEFGVYGRVYLKIDDDTWSPYGKKRLIIQWVIRLIMRKKQLDELLK